MPILLLVIILGSLFGRPAINHDLPRSTARAVATSAGEKAPLGVKAEGVYVAQVGKTDRPAIPVIGYRQNQAWPIASLTKLMTALVLLDEKPNLNKLIALQKDDYVGGATLEVPVGTKMTLSDLLHASLMSSANNATDALVRGADMNRQEFVEKMNAKARDLGLKNTTFVEPTGLEPANKSTPEEYAKIITQALANPAIREIMAKTYYEIDPANYPRFAVGSTNQLLKEPQAFEVVGGKTGFTDGSDYNFAAQVKKGSKEVVVVVFGDKTFNGAFDASKKLAQEALDKAN